MSGVCKLLSPAVSSYLIQLNYFMCFSKLHISEQGYVNSIIAKIVNKCLQFPLLLKLYLFLIAALTKN